MFFSFICIAQKIKFSPKDFFSPNCGNTDQKNFEYGQFLPSVSCQHWTVFYLFDINTNFLGVYKWNTYKGEFGLKAYYLNWNYGEPNDKFYEPLSGDCPGEDCIQIRKFSGNVTWHDLSCETKIPYLCEKIRGNLLNLHCVKYRNFT